MSTTTNSKFKNAIGEGLPKTGDSEWANSSARPKGHTPVKKGMKNMAGDGMPQMNTSWKNAGAITWNTKDASYEDTEGIKYQINDDKATFDDGSGNNFNPDGSIAASVSAPSSPNFLNSILGFLTSPATTSKVLDLAIAKINADTSLSAQQKAAQIAQINGSTKTANSWVMPVVVIGGILVASASYYYFIKRKK